MFSKIFSFLSLIASIATFAVSGVFLVHRVESTLSVFPAILLLITTLTMVIICTFNHYNAVEDKERLPISLTLYQNDKVLFSRAQKVSISALRIIRQLLQEVRLTRMVRSYSFMLQMWMHNTPSSKQLRTGDMTCF